MHKEGDNHMKLWRKAIIRNLKREKHKKEERRGRRTLYSPQPPLQPFPFLLS